MFLEKFMRFTSRFIYPTFSRSFCLGKQCLVCGFATSTSENICVLCLQNFPILPHGCQKCAKFLPGLETTELICGTCLLDPPPFERIYALYPYQPPITQLIIELKFNHALTHAKALGELLVKKIVDHWYREKPLPDLIIPVPLHNKRLSLRGFNQALEIARPIYRHLKLPIDAQSLLRIKYTEPQSGLSKAARKRNIAQAFATTRHYSGLSVALIDDVVTTGQTITEICHLLKKKGAKRIDIWCCARRG